MRDNLEGTAVHGLRVLVLVLALVIPFVARAASEGEIRNYIISISRLYENLDYELALNRIQLARQLRRGTDEEVTLALYEGIILCEMGRVAPGTSAFKSALFLRPDAKLPVQVAPKVEKHFESVRKKVKSEMAVLLPQRETEKPSNKAEQARTEQAQKVSPAPSATMAVTGTPVSPSHAEGSSPPLERRPDCGPEPSSVSSLGLKERQLWRLTSMEHELCMSGRFQGSVAAKWSDLKTRMEGSSTSHERALISQDIDQFAREIGYPKAVPRPKAELKKAAPAKPTIVEAPPPVPLTNKADREQLLQRLLYLQGEFLRTDPPSRLVPIRELVKIRQKIQAASTAETLQESAHDLDSWQQRHLPQ